MSEKIGRNDPCSCGSGKKYKSCCMKKDLPQATGKKKFSANLLNKTNPVSLMERALGGRVSQPKKEEQKPVSPETTSELDRGQIPF